MEAEQPVQEEQVVKQAELSVTYIVVTCAAWLGLAALMFMEAVGQAGAGGFMFFGGLGALAIPALILHLVLAASLAHKDDARDIVSFCVFVAYGLAGCALFVVASAQGA